MTPQLLSRCTGIAENLDGLTTPSIVETQSCDQCLMAVTNNDFCNWFLSALISPAKRLLDPFGHFTSAGAVVVNINVAEEANKYVQNEIQKAAIHLHHGEYFLSSALEKIAGH